MELLQQTVKKNLLAKQKVGITQKFLGALISDVLTQKKELKDHQKGTHRLLFGVKKPHKNNAVRFAPVLAVGTR